MVNESQNTTKAAPAPRQRDTGAHTGTAWPWVLALIGLGLLLRAVEAVPAIHAAGETISFFAFLWAFFWLGYRWRDAKCTLCWRPGPLMRLSESQSCRACQRHRHEIREWWEAQQARARDERDVARAAIGLNARDWIVIRGGKETGA